MSGAALQADERRTATVMFADISGFTALSEKLDPEDMTNVMNGCFERLESIVMAHGGIVDEYLGDCVKAVFGFAPDIADPTIHAVYAALEMRAAVYTYNQEAALASPLDIHIGLNTGPVTPILLGKGLAVDFCVLGDAARLAGRLEDVSDRGDIYVGPDTYAATCKVFDYEPRPPVELRPYPEPYAVHALLGPKLSAPIVRGSERRQATVVFAEVIGLDNLAAQMDATAHANALRQLFERFGSVVDSFGGVVDKYLGEGIMALFGVPNAIENAPRQGLNCAIAIRNLVADFEAEQRLASHLSVHIGVNTGLCIAGDIGGRVKRDFTVMGDTVNLAARLKEAAGHAAIYIGPETHRYTRDEFAFEPIEPLRLKGKSQPVPAFALVSRQAQVHRSTAVQGDRRIFSAIIGRDNEVAQLDAALDRLVAGHGAVVALIGEAGLGKSRLLAEAFARQPRGGMRTLLGRAIAIGSGLSFHPFIDLFRQWIGIDDESDESATERLARALREITPAQCDDLFPFIARLMGLPLSGAAAERLADIEGEALEKLIIRSVRELLTAFSADRPTVLVFEDLHWADQSSLTLLDSLVAMATEARLLFVLVTRPATEAASEATLQHCRSEIASHYSEVRLAPLSVEQTADLVGNLLGIRDLPLRVTRRIAEKADGNPFYIEEVVRSFIDEGAVEQRDGEFFVTERIDTVQIPGTIHDVIMARVDRLDEATRHLLQIASVIGRRFFHGVLAHVVDRQVAVDEALRVLRDKEMIQQTAGRWEAQSDGDVGAEVEYMFKHALAQEAVYESILLRRRRELHAAVGDAIEITFPERLNELSSTLAHHYVKAEKWEPAERYLFTAGEEAERSAASAEALLFFRQAADLYERLYGAGGDPKRKAAYQKHIGMALLNTGKHDDSIVHFDSALELMGETVSKSLVAQALRWGLDMSRVLLHVYLADNRFGSVPDLEHEREVCKLYFERGHAEVTSDPQRLFLELATGLRRLTRIDPKLIDEACGMYVSCAGIFAYSGLSFAISKRMMGAAKSRIRDGSVRDQFVYRAFEFTYAYLRGDWAGAPLVDDAMVQQALGQGMVWDVTLYVGLEMDRRLRRGEWTEARRMLAILASIRDDYGYAYAGSNHNGMLCILLLERRELEECLSRSQAHHIDSTEGTIRLFTMGMVAKAQILLGRHQEAAESLRQCTRIAKEERVASPWHLSSHHVAQLRFDLDTVEASLRDTGRVESALRRGALRNARRALSTAAKVGKERIETYNLAGCLWWALGSRRRARSWWERCLDEAEAMGARPELARLHAAIGQRLGGERLRDRGSEDFLEAARRGFQQLGLSWDLEQLDRLARIGDRSPEAEVA